MRRTPAPVSAPLTSVMSASSTCQPADKRPVITCWMPAVAAAPPASVKAYGWGAMPVTRVPPVAFAQFAQFVGTPVVTMLSANVALVLMLPCDPFA